MVRVIAEVGVNHDGNLDKALELTSVAANCGADVIKFQTFSAELIVTRAAEKATYQKKNTAQNSQFEMLKDLELSFENHFVIKRFAESLGLEFLSTPFDLNSLNFLADDLELRTVKISSGDITNFPLLSSAGEKFSNVILSTGGSTLTEVESAIKVLSQSHEAALGLKSATEQLSIVILHCTSEYPAPDSEINLKAIQTLQSKFSFGIGYSDHTIGNQASIMAVTLGATVLEKHITLDTKSSGPDHSSSLDPEGFKEFVESIRRAESMLGDGIKKPSKSEFLNVPKIRRGLYAAKSVEKGELFTERNIIALRPEGAFSASRYFELLGTRAVREFQEGDQLEI